MGIIQYLSVVLLISISTSIFSQAKNNNYYQVGFNYEAGIYKGIEININYIQNQKYSYQIFINNSRKYAVNLPHDYRSGGLLASDNKLSAYNISIGIMFGRVYPLFKGSKSKINLKGGIVSNYFRFPENFEYVGCGSLFCFKTNYTYTYEKIKNIGLLLNPSLELILSKQIGLSVAPFLNLNTHETTIGFQIGIYSQSK